MNSIAFHLFCFLDDTNFSSFHRFITETVSSRFHFELRDDSMERLPSPDSPIVLIINSINESFKTINEEQRKIRQRQRLNDVCNEGQVCAQF